VAAGWVVVTTSSGVVTAPGVAQAARISMNRAENNPSLTTVNFISIFPPIGFLPDIIHKNLSTNQAFPTS
jgi:hypothetical protein